MIEFSKKSEFPVGVEKLFDWHERPGAFGRLAPPWQTVKLTKHSGGIRDGAQVEVDIKVGPVPQTLKIRHEGYIYGERFVDVMESGPFHSWRHEHLFESTEHPERSVLHDKLNIEPLGGALGNMLGGGMIERELDQVFTYRHWRLLEDLKRANSLSELPFTGKVLITGVTGMLGRATAAYLQTRGYSVLGVSRSGRGPWPGLSCLAWDPEKKSINASDLEGVDAVINLAGESILGPWSQNKMKRIRSSREDAVATLIQAFEQIDSWPKVWINASGSGFYGPQTDGPVSESNESGAGFLAHVCRAWEDALTPIRDKTRVVFTRLGTVMSPAGGALNLMLPVFRMGGGGILGNPKAKMPWIALDDVVYGFEYLFYRDVEGPANFVSPEILTQAHLTRTLAKVLNRPAFIPAPAGVLRTVLGSLAKEVFLIDQNVKPSVLSDIDFQYSSESFEACLRNSLGIR
ncbi:MAG: TIGR01777 family oxidoreductase [Cyanobacteria bacterium P01_A01_bin.68]